MTKDYPKKVCLAKVAGIVPCHPRTLTRMLGLDFTVANSEVPFLKLAKVLQADPDWLMRCLAGDDYGVTLPQAANALAMSVHSLDAANGRYAALKPAARLRKGMRFSARALGLYRDPSATPLAGHPDSNVLCADGWHTDSYAKETRR